MRPTPFDPDVGMEPGQATAKHLRFDELRDVVSGMDSASVAVVFQYLGAWRTVGS
jgi:hypothetical protein